MPPAALPTLWNAEDRFVETYLSTYPGHYETADAGFIDEDGYVHVMARTDDIINVAGHRLSTGALEEVLTSHPDVAECAVVGVADQLKGQLPVGFLVLKVGAEGDDDVVTDVVAAVRERIGPVAAFRSAVVVDRLPKTRSGKILGPWFTSSRTQRSAGRELGDIRDEREKRPGLSSPARVPPVRSRRRTPR